jgi:hypothetical protein
MDLPSIHEEVLGRLTWDAEFACWSGETELVPGQPVGLFVSQGDAGLPAALRSARGTLELLRLNEADLRRRAAEELLDLHNEEWNDGLSITQEEFVERMTLESIAFFPDGGAELCYHDSGLFEGHAILLRVGADGAFDGATLAG